MPLISPGARICPACRASNTTRANFCARCGYGLRSAAPDLLDQAVDLVTSVLKSASLRQGAQALSAATREALAGMQDFMDSGTGTRVRLEGTPLAPKVRRLRSQPPPPPSAAGPVRAGCARCGAVRGEASNYCTACGSPFEWQPGRPLRFGAAVLSDQGRVRSNNEDDARLWLEPAGSNCVALIADGMGGENAGEVASREAAETITRALNQYLLSPERRLRPGANLPEVLSHAIQQANAAIFQLAQRSPALGHMGTTATLALCSEDRLYVAHVGDSRAYLMNAQGVLWQVTQDHTLVASLAAMGQISAAEAESHPQRNLLYRCVGQSAATPVDSYLRRLASGDRILLCSDGLPRHASPAEISGELVRSPTPQSACSSLVNLANRRGGEDNISVIVIHVF